MEKFFWADELADEIIKRKKKEYVCAAGVTPSGMIHIGNFRDAITNEIVVRALRDKGKKVRFIYSFDDYDRFRKVPANLPQAKKEKYEDYIGMAVSDIPSPFGKGSYADYFEGLFKKELENVGILPEFIQQSTLNKKCVYAPLIKKALDKKEEIREILNKYRKAPLEKDWVPLNVYCERCKKDTTKVLNVEGYSIEYECECGFKNKIDYRKKGIVKLPWRVDWPMRWVYYKEDFESAGIDHSVYGGSVMTSDEVDRKIFDFDPPLHTFYEWIRIKGGKEFASSTGDVTTLTEVQGVYEPEIIRYIFVHTRPRKAFQISFDADVIKLYDEYDALEEKYYNKTATPQERRIYELSQIKLAKKKPEKLGFKHLITFVQIGKTEGLNSESKIRAEKVQNWLENYAPEDFKFKVSEKVSAKLDTKQKQALKALKESLAVKDFTEDELFNEFYDICGAVGLENKEFFEGAYMTIIGKVKGPRLASLILAIGKDKIIKLLEQI